MTTSRSEATTDGIRVEVEARYAAEHSEPGRQWFFLYTVTVANLGPETVKLVSRQWTITDGTGAVQEVRGLGVVGEQPTLEPGSAFEYTSGCPLPTPFGSMSGTYQMVTGQPQRGRLCRGQFGAAGLAKNNRFVPQSGKRSKGVPGLFAPDMGNRDLLAKYGGYISPRPHPSHQTSALGHGNDRGTDHYIQGRITPG